MAEKKNIFILGKEPFTSRLLDTVRGAEELEFHQLLDYDGVTDLENHSIPEMMDGASKVLRDFEGSIDGIIAYWDFPSTCLQPVLREQFGLPGPTLDTVLKAEHKYWSRIHQERAAPEMTPGYAAVDPAAADALEKIEARVAYPFFIKPVEAHSSVLGYGIESREDFKKVLPEVRDNIGLFGDPFSEVLSLARELPDEIAEMGGKAIIAEEIVSGHQCTLEGYEHGGEVVVYGEIDTLKVPGGFSLARYQYPSRLPRSVLDRMRRAATRVVGEMGYQNEPFNIEFFWNEETDRIWFLEFNTRTSKSHFPLFYMVDGVSQQQVPINLQLGRAPDMPHREGDYPMAAKFMMREEKDGVVTRAPSGDEVADLEKRFPGTFIKMEVAKGDRLSDLPYQEEYTFETGAVFVGGESQERIERRYDEILKALPLDIDFDEE